MSFKTDKILKYQLFFTVGILVMIEIFLVVNLAIYLYDLPLTSKNVVLLDDNPSDIDSAYRRRIDGVVSSQDNQNLVPVAVMIDNFPDSRPNYGLSYASLVYETLVENGATRFLAFYAPSPAEDYTGADKIGPVRSTRPYFLEIVKEYDALHAHSGGSPQALIDIEDLGINNLEEISWFGPDYFWRVYSRQPPHNLFTSEKKLAQAVADWELDQALPVYRPWKFKSIESATATDPTLVFEHDLSSSYDILVNFSLGTAYDAGYRYDYSSNSYLRYQDGKIHIDALNNQPIKVKNVIIQYLSPKAVMDQVGRVSLDLIGQGRADIYIDGEKISGSWRRRDIDSRTVFYDENDEEIIFTPGNIWIALLPP